MVCCVGCNCIDVSEHNGNINWTAVKNDGVDYALIRCGFGRDIESQDDKYFHINMEGALNAGLKVGVYFYSYADYGDAAAEEAEHCLRLINGYKDKLSLSPSMISFIVKPARSMLLTLVKPVP